MLFTKVFTATVLGAIAKLAIGIALFSATTVQAQEIRTLQDYLNNCIPENEDEDLPEECDRLKETRDLEEDEGFPRRERRSPEEAAEPEKSGGISGYAGIVLGVYFPDIDEDRAFFEGNDVETDTGIGSSLFGGIKFNRYLGIDLELGAFTGDVDSDLDEDENYTFGGLFLNPRFTLPLSDKKNSLGLFLSPGLGISQLATSIEDEVDDFDRTTIIEDESRFTWQIKGGISVPVSRKLSVLGQLRYTSQTGDNAIDYFGTELGAKFDF